MKLGDGLKSAVELMIARMWQWHLWARILSHLCVDMIATRLQVRKLRTEFRVLGDQQLEKDK